MLCPPKYSCYQAPAYGLNNIISKHNILDNGPNQSSISETKKLVEMKNYDSRETYSTNCQIRIKTRMLKSSLCDYSNPYIFVKGMMIITGIAADTAARPADKKDKGVIILHHSLTA